MITHTKSTKAFVNSVVFFLNSLVIRDSLTAILSLDKQKLLEAITKFLTYNNSNTDENIFNLLKLIEQECNKTNLKFVWSLDKEIWEIDTL